MRAQLECGDDAPIRLRALVSWFDVTLTNASVDQDRQSGRQALTFAIAATGRLMIERQGVGDDHPVARTLAAADTYLHRPTAETYQAYQLAATGSYPFGAGDGCYAMEGFNGCGPGSGCRSGAGSLMSMAMTLGADAVLAAIADELARTDRT